MAMEDLISYLDKSYDLTNLFLISLIHSCAQTDFTG